MPTETLIHSIFEFRVLLEQLDRQAKTPAPSRADPSQTLEDLVEAVVSSGNSLLGESQQLLLVLHEILNHSLTGIAVVAGEALTLRLISTGFRAMIPQSNLGLRGRAYAEIWQPAASAEHIRLVQQVIRSQPDAALVERFDAAYPDGQPRSFLQQVSFLRWHGEPGALILLHELVPAQMPVRPQDALDDAQGPFSSEEFNTIINAMADAVTVSDAGGQAIRANQAAVELFGFDPISLRSENLIEFLSIQHPDGSPVADDDLPLWRAGQGEAVVGEHLLVTDASGSERVVRVSASPLYAERQVTAVVTIWHDITERERLLEQLEIEQSRLETIIMTAPEAILVADEEGRLVMANPAAERVLGREITPMPDIASLAEFHFCYPDGAPYAPRNLPLTCSALDGERVRGAEMVIELPGGQARHLLASAAPIVDRKGNLNGAVGVLQDITQQRQEEEALRRQANRSLLLASLSRAFAEMGLQFNDLLETVTQQVGQAFGDLCCLHLLNNASELYTPAAIYRKDSQDLEYLEQILRGVYLGIGEEQVAGLFQAGKPVNLVDFPVCQAGELLPSLPQSTCQLLPNRPVNILVAPLRAHGRWVGVLSIVRAQPGEHFTREDEGFLQDLADRAALAVEDARLYEREAQRARELQALHRSTTALLTTLDLEGLLAQILDAAQQAVPAARQVVLYMLSPEDGQLRVRAAFDYHHFRKIQNELQEHSMRAIREKRALILTNLSFEELDSSGSALIAPLIHAHRPMGTLVLFGPHPELFGENDLRLVDSFAATATLALQNAMLYSEVQRLAVTDTLTDQFNRHRFFELGEMEIQRFQRHHTPLSAIMLDLDHFKEINDTYGHGVGDQVLRVVAMRCRAGVRVFDILGRYGGDEFAILLPGADLTKALEVAERIKSSVTQSPVHTNQGDMHVSLSLGVAQADTNTTSLSVLLARADEALYSAKEQGRNRIHASKKKIP